MTKGRRPPPPPRCHYFDVVVGLVWSNDPEGQSGDSVATGRVTQAGQLITQAKRDPLVPQVGGWAWG